MAAPITTTSALYALKQLSPGVRVDAIVDALKHADEAEADALGCALLDLIIPEIDALRERPQTEPAAPAAGGRLSGFASRIGGRLSGADRIAAARRASEALIAAWPRLTDNVRGLVLSAAPDVWAIAARSVAARAADGDPGAAEAIGELLTSAPWPIFAPAATELLNAESRAAVRTAEAAIVTMVRPLIGEWPAEWLESADLPRHQHAVFRAPEASNADNERTINAIAGAAWAYPTHLCRGPVRSALLLLAATREGKLDRRIAMRVERLLDDHAHAAHAAMARALRRSRAPLLRRLALRLLTDNGMAAAALERVVNGGSAPDHAAMLDLGHLALRPARARALASIRVPRLTSGSSAGLLPGPAALARLRPHARREALRLAHTARIDEDRRRAVTETFLVDGSAANRLAAATCADVRDLPDFCFDADAGVAAHAFRRWSRADASLSQRWPPKPADETRVRILTKLARSPHPAVRTMTAREIRSSSPWAADDPRSRLLARRWAATDREGFEQSVRRRLETGDVQLRVATIMMLRRLGVVADFEQTIVELAGERADAERADRVAATAVIALAGRPSDLATGAVRRAIASDDDRVRANAVEALTTSPRASEDDASTLVELKADRHHRVRANAIRAMLRPPRSSRPGRIYEPIAVEQLRSMLADSRAPHRLAAAWLAGRVLVGEGRVALGPHWEPLTRALADTARDDEDAAVRRRARSGVRRVLGEMRAVGVGGATEVRS